MDRYNLLKTKFDKKEKIVGTTMTMIGSSLILEKMAGREDIDYILFDTEHGIFDAQNLVPLLQTMRLLKVPSLVRVQDAEYHLVAKLIDMELVRLDKGTAGKNSKLVSLTESGLQRCEECVKPLLVAENNALSQMDDSQVNQFLQLYEMHYVKFECEISRLLQEKAK